MTIGRLFAHRHGHRAENPTHPQLQGQVDVKGRSVCACASVHRGVPVCVRSGRRAAEQAGEPVVLTDPVVRMQGA